VIRPEGVTVVNVETRQSGDVLIVVPVETRIDAYISAAFRSELLRRIDDGARLLVVNLQHVEFMDSAALGVLLSALKHVGLEGELKACSPRPAVRSMFELTRLNRIIPLLETEAEALSSFRAPSGEGDAPAMSQ
jgi:anti-sigma B factor antagonist